MVYKNKVHVMLFCFILHFDWSTEDKIKIRVPESTVQKMAEQAEICGEKHGLSPDNVYKIVTWDAPNDEAFKKFTYCIDSNLGLADEDGHFVTEHFLNMHYNNTREEVKAIFDECNKTTKETPHETLYVLSDCVSEWIEWSA